MNKYLRINPKKKKKMEPGLVGYKEFHTKPLTLSFKLSNY